MQKKNKKKLFILIWDMGIGGIQKRLKDIILDLHKNKKEVEIFLLIHLNRPGFFLKKIERETGAHIITSPYYNYGDLRPLPYIRRFIAEVKLFSWLLKTVHKEKPDIFLTFLDRLSVSAVLTKNLLFWRNMKLVLNEGVFTSDYIKLHRRQPFFWKCMVLFFYSHAHKIIVPTLAIKNDLVKNFLVPSKLITVIPNWTLLDVKKKAREKFYDLIFVGRFEKEKNPLQFLDIVQKLKIEFPKIKACMIGTGRMERDIKNFIKKKSLKNNLFVLGYRPNIKSYLLKSKIMLLTTSNEGLPNVVIEAAACYVPSIVNNFPGASEVVINSKTGFIVKKKSDFVGYSSMLLKNNKLRNKLAAEAKERVDEKFSYKNQNKFIGTLLN